MMKNLARLSRSFWKPVLVAFLCSLSIVSVDDRTAAQSIRGNRKQIQKIRADRKALMVEAKASFQSLLQRMNRIEVLWKQGAVSDAQYRQAQSDVASTQKQLNRLICENLISPEIFILGVQLQSAIRQKEWYQVLFREGAISHVEFLNVKQNADWVQEDLDEAIENDPVSKNHINKTKECRDWGK